MGIKEVFIDHCPGCEHVVPGIVTPGGPPSPPIDPSVGGHPKKKSAKLRTDTSKAYQIKNSGGNDVICFVCGNKGHGECTLKRDGLKCNNCKRTGHLAKACQSKPDSGHQQKDRRRDKARVVNQCFLCT